MAEKPSFRDFRPDALAYCAWKPPLSADGMKAQEALLRYNMKRDQPGVRYKMVQEQSGDYDALLAVPLDGR